MKNTTQQEATRTHAADPTIEPRGFVRNKPKTRHLRRHVQREYSGNHTVALTPCVVTLADGTEYILRKNRNRTTLSTPQLGRVVHIRRRTLVTDLPTTLDRAERLGLNLTNVAQIYRHRRDNGYGLQSDVTTNETYAFRGQEV